MDEKLKYMRFDQDVGELVVQFTDGGNAHRFPRGATVKEVVEGLRDLAARIEDHARARNE